MSDEHDYDDTDTGQPCPRCHNCDTRWRECGECEEGYVNRYDDDPMWYDDKYVKCGTCHGMGAESWCPKCGLDLFSKEAERLRNPKPKTQPPPDPSQLSLLG